MRKTDDEREELAPCLIAKINPNVLVMQSAEMRR